MRLLGSGVATHGGPRREHLSLYFLDVVEVGVWIPKKHAKMKLAQTLIPKSCSATSKMIFEWVDTITSVMRSPKAHSICACPKQMSFLQQFHNSAT